ncbi:fibroblast growth factor 18a isoform X1 [Epinephelus fuscoguttatus]|uniref:fibroblast growth factor 18a isoform X1 n=1 Tax=Epinephelus fuscoguttatus TaxID=293821 RepID=UPI0020D12886|nr:fibroblast growth factor 18a isoform X1 [Epinephelus fuscoguttatus]
MWPLLSTLTVLCIQMLLVMCNPLQQVLGVDGVNFSVHVENQTQVRDTMSRRHHRVYQLYSRTSGKHVQVLGRRISARGEDGDKFAQLVVEADTFGSQVRIRGKETNFYLCMNRRGKLVGKVRLLSFRDVFIKNQIIFQFPDQPLFVSPNVCVCVRVPVVSLLSQKASNRSDDCVFVEKVLENHYTALMSARYTGWYVGFTKRGRPRRGPHTLPNQQDVHFMKRFPPGEQPDLTTPFRFTTVSKRGKRVRATGPR